MPDGVPFFLQNWLKKIPPTEQRFLEKFLVNILAACAKASRRGYSPEF